MDEGKKKYDKCPHGLPRYNPGAEICSTCLSNHATIYCPFDGKSAFDCHLGGEDEYRKYEE